MITHFRYHLTALCLLLTATLTPATAQTVTSLWACGSAVPDGCVELTAFPGKLFKFAGELREGELRIRNTQDHRSSSYYVKPKYEDSYIINNGLPFTLTRDTTAWVVPVSEGRYRFTVDLNAKTVKGELFTPWNELFMVGGATDIGWESYIMLPFTREEDELCTWTWTGELRNHPEHNEPRRFKILGQNAWEPKALHPFTADEDVLTSQYLLTNGTGDNKWETTKDGYYTLRVDVFRE
ncbi:MAG: SusF/SusE family outer membrane protein, partial [Bacteroidaceae bacterium]|nr:SusF/SusE family outer membrane protein [Bacteroidaceae bacterium]